MNQKKSGFWSAVFLTLVIAVGAIAYQQHQQYPLNDSSDTMSDQRTLDAASNDKQRSLEGEGNSQGPWKECLGMTFDDCKAVIAQAAPDLKNAIFEIPPDSMVTMDYNTHRVRVYVDEQHIVTRVPQRG